MEDNSTKVLAIQRAAMGIEDKLRKCFLRWIDKAVAAR